MNMAWLSSRINLAVGVVQAVQIFREHIVSCSFSVSDATACFECGLPGTALTVITRESRQAIILIERYSPQAELTFSLDSEDRMNFRIKSCNKPGFEPPKCPRKAHPTPSAGFQECLQGGVIVPATGQYHQVLLLLHKGMSHISSLAVSVIP
jgi:hypothetical protein